jgi:hypothetical protein
MIRSGSSGVFRRKIAWREKKEKPLKVRMHTNIKLHRNVQDEKVSECGKSGGEIASR